MKQRIAVPVLCIGRYGTMGAGEAEARRTLTKGAVERIEKDLINAFQSNIPGLQASAAITLLQVRRVVPEYDWPSSIITLMRIVNVENSSADTRIAAALALHELRTDCGDYSIVLNARFTSDRRVKRVCSMLAAYRLSETMTP